MSSKLAHYIKTLLTDFSAIADNRKLILTQLATSISRELDTKSSANLIFICTHNSRRSQLAEVWAKMAAEYYGLTSIATYSGGTEATAFYPAVIAALERAGFDIRKMDETPNPKYRIQLGMGDRTQSCFSKEYSNEFNPQNDFLAIMVCSDADEHCPIVVGAKTRIVLPYIDPKIADGTAEEAATYDARSLEIATEMFFVMGKVKEPKKNREENERRK